MMRPRAPLRGQIYKLYVPRLLLHSLISSPLLPPQVLNEADMAPISNSTAEAHAASLGSTPPLAVTLHTHPPCLLCKNHAMSHCEGCKNAIYCSEACQKADWPLHKMVCRSFQEFQTRPTPRHTRALLFLANGTSPRFVWIELKGDSFYSFCPEEYTGHNCRTLFTDMYGRFDRHLGYNMHAWYNDNFMGDGSPANKPLMKCFGQYRARNMRGSFLVQGCGGELEDFEGGPVDLDTTALNPFLDLVHDRIPG